MTLEKELEDEEVLVGKCMFNASAWQIAQLMDEATFKKFAKISGWATHYDKPDFVLNEAVKKSYMAVDKELVDADFKPVQGRPGVFTLDLEVYMTSLGALTFMVTAEGE